MFCRNCKQYIRGVVNKVRHQLATKERNVDFDCGKFREIPIGKAVHVLDNEMVDLSLFVPKMKEIVTLRKFMRIMRLPDLKKFNNRNHDEGSHGSDVHNSAYLKGYTSKRQSKKQRKSSRASRKKQNKNRRELDVLDA